MENTTEIEKRQLALNSKGIQSGTDKLFVIQEKTMIRDFYWCRGIIGGGEGVEGVRALLIKGD